MWSARGQRYDHDSEKCGNICIHVHAHSLNNTKSAQIQTLLTTMNSRHLDRNLLTSISTSAAAKYENILNDFHN